MIFAVFDVSVTACRCRR